MYSAEFDIILDSKVILCSLLKKVMFVLNFYLAFSFSLSDLEFSKGEII